MRKYNESRNKISLDANNMFAEYIGGMGINEDELRGFEEAAKNAKNGVDGLRADGKITWAELPYNQVRIVKEITEYVKEVKDEFDAFVVLGIGGSALGPIAVQQALNHPFYNELPRKKRGGFPRFYVADNVDPERLVYLFDTIDVKKTLFNVVTKSGSTSETMSQFMIIKTILQKKLGKKEARKRIVCTTDAEKGNLIKIAREEGYKTFIIPNGVGGRFSELCPVGLLPAAMAGIDINGLLAGARYMDSLCKSENVFENPALMYAALSCIMLRRNVSMSVMMPYADSLKYIADWYAQLWAESLGKKHDKAGNVVNVGPTPIKALGVTDQHSQVQLYAEGPFDKYVVLIGVEKYREEITIPKTYKDIASLGFLGGVKHSELIHVEQAATEYALMKQGKANMTLTLPEVNEFTIGQLLYLFELATAYAGEMLNIDAFDQPGVEEGKNATYAMFGRPGYEDKKKELDSRPEKNRKYIL